VAILKRTVARTDRPRWQRPLLTLGARLAATTTLLLLASSGVLFVNLTVRERKNTVASKAIAAEMVTNLVAAALAAPLDFGDLNDVRASLDVLKTNDDVTGAAIWDGDAVAPLLEWHRESTDPVKRGPATVAADAIEVVRPIDAPSRGAPRQLTVRFSLARENTAYAQSSKWLFGMLLVLAGVTAALLNAMMRLQIVNPLKRLVTAASDLERGAPTAQVDVAANDEIGTLARAFNKMGHAVASRHARLENAVKDERVESAARFRMLIEAIPDAIVLCQTGRITYANPSFVALVGGGAGDLVGSELGAVLPGRDPSAQASPGSPEPGEERWQVDGRTVVVEARTLTVQIDGKTSTLLIARDVTEHRRFQAKLAQADAESRQAQKMEAIGRLAGGVAHDFNNMLSIILGYAIMLLDGLTPADPMYGPLSEITEAGERSADLTRQLLAFSRQQPLESKIVNLNDAVERTAKMVRLVLGTDVELSTVLDPRTCDTELDPGQLEQVIMNLMFNARDAMPAGGRLTLETSVALGMDGDDAECNGLRPGDYVTLTVSDNGTGMDKETQERIFEPFFTTKEQGRGTGLGLSTVFGIVQQSGGHITVHSELGKGTSFKLFFLRRDAAAVSPPDEPRRPSLATGRETVLLVEDEEQVLKMVHEVLRRKGYDVLVAKSPKEALATCARHTGDIHLLLTDVMMPEMNGPELARALLASRPDMKVLYMSGYTDDVVLPHEVGGSAGSFLQKPITPEVLCAKVRRILGAPLALAG
jgi:PAS domain S-box-containing protein